MSRELERELHIWLLAAGLADQRARELASLSVARECALDELDRHRGRRHLAQFCYLDKKLNAALQKEERDLVFLQLACASESGDLLACLCGITCRGARQDKLRFFLDLLRSTEDKRVAQGCVCALDQQLASADAVQQVTDDELALFARAVMVRGLSDLTRDLAASIVAKIRSTRPSVTPDVDFAYLVAMACKATMAAGFLSLLAVYVRMDSWDSYLLQDLVGLSVHRLYDKDVRANRAAASLVLALKLRGATAQLLDACVVEALVSAWKAYPRNAPCPRCLPLQALAHLCGEPDVARTIVALGGLPLLFIWLRERKSMFAWHLLHGLARQDAVPADASLLGLLVPVKADDLGFANARLKVAREVARDPRAAASLLRLKVHLL
jgi:hypothetical protein